MSNYNEPNTLVPFNNNKSLYGPRTQTNQPSKKISIIEDKTTLEPAHPNLSSSVTYSTNLHSKYQRLSSSNISILSEPSPLQIRKQIQIQKEALDSIELKQMHDHVYQQLDEWKNSMYFCVQSRKNRMLEKNTQEYNHLIEFQNLMEKVLEDELIKQLLSMKNNPQAINSQQLDEIEQKLLQIKVLTLRV